MQLMVVIGFVNSYNCEKVNYKKFIREGLFMFRKADEMTKEIKERMRGGEGTVEITHIFKQEELGGKARLVAKITINPGCSIGLHEHVNEEEIYYIIKGKCIVDDNSQQREMNPGDALLTGGGAVHSIKNTANEPLELVAVILLY